MIKNINYVSHKKSKVKNNGKPQLPSANSLVEGEIAINYAKGVETLSIKNESGTVVTFSSDNYYTEEKLGSGFTESNSAVTVTSAMFEIEKAISDEMSRATNVETALDGRMDTLEENVAYLGENDGSAVIADFDPQTDTVWNKPQVLSSSQKAQVRQNIDVYSKAEVNNVAATPRQNYSTVSNYESLPSSGSTDTIYRVSSYNGTTSTSADTMYSEYAWDGSNYVLLAVKSQVDEVYDISVNHAGATYLDLAAALGTNGDNIPQDLRRGGMSIKFVQSSDDKYVQYRLMSDSFNTTEANWQGVDDEPTDRSENLVKSGGVWNKINQLSPIDSDHDLSFQDEVGNAIVEFDDGHIKTKNFDSKDAVDYIKYLKDMISYYSKSDFAISDDNGNNILELNRGHIKTKNFDSENVENFIPDYYKTEVTRVLNSYYGYSEAGRIGYIFISDLHFSGDSDNVEALLRQIKAAVNIANSANIDFLAFGGDYINGTDTKSIIYSAMQQTNEILAKCNKPIVFISGNHDDNSYSTSGVAEKGAIARNIFVDATNVVNPVFGSADKDDCYYYFELPKKNVRVICLDFIDYPQNKKGTNWWGYSETQVKWFCSDALNTNKDIIILSHGQLVDKRYGWYNHEDDGGYATDIKNAIIAFNGKTSITLYGITYNFADKQGNIILSQCGHWHGDLELSIGSIPAIVTGCAKHAPADYQGRVTDGYYQPVTGKDDTFIIPSQEAADAIHANGYGYEFVIPSNRDYNTINEALFDVVSVNSSAIHCIRFGAGFDRNINID